MKPELTTLDGLTLMTVKTRTNNDCEMDPTAAKIAGTAQRYFVEQTADKFQGRLTPGVTYGTYSNYESDELGDYDYAIGENVGSNAAQAPFHTLEIPAGPYAKFTVGPGKMPDIIIDAWQKIWQMDDEVLGGERSYLVDFEVYDERAMDPDNTVVDVYIGLETTNT